MKLTRKQIIEELKRLKTHGDTEAAHARADELLLLYINNKEVTEVYNDIDKWYA